jgi:hypothetical protein
MMPSMDPLVARHLPAISVAAAVLGGEGHVPLWQYLAERQAFSSPSPVPPQAPQRSGTPRVAEGGGAKPLPERGRGGTLGQHAWAKRGRSGDDSMKTIESDTAVNRCSRASRSP